MFNIMSKRPILDQIKIGFFEPTRTSLLGLQNALSERGVLPNVLKPHHFEDLLNYLTASSRASIACSKVHLNISVQNLSTFTFM